jgi:hypothetical protein
MKKANLLIALILLSLGLNCFADCEVKTINIEGKITYQFYIDECGVKPVFVKGKLPVNSTRADLKMYLANLFASEDVLTIQSDFFDSKRVVKNINNIDIKKWHKLGKNYEFCYEEKFPGACREFVRIKFRSGNLQFTYNRI